MTLGRIRRRYLTNLGDADPLTWGGLFVYVYDNDNDNGTAVMEKLEEPAEDTHHTCHTCGVRMSAILCENDCRDTGLLWTIYRVSLYPCTLVDGVLSDNRYHPSHCAWFAATPDSIAARPQDGNGLDDVAASMDYPRASLEADLCSGSPLRMAQAYRAIYDHHGWTNGDSYPVTLTRAEVEARYTRGELEVDGVPQPDAQT